MWCCVVLCGVVWCCVVWGCVSLLYVDVQKVIIRKKKKKKKKVELKERIWVGAEVMRDGKRRREK